MIMVTAESEKDVAPLSLPSLVSILRVVVGAMEEESAPTEDVRGLGSAVDGVEVLLPVLSGGEVLGEGERVVVLAGVLVTPGLGVGVTVDVGRCVVLSPGSVLLALRVKSNNFSRSSINAC